MKVKVALAAGLVGLGLLATMACGGGGGNALDAVEQEAVEAEQFLDGYGKGWMAGYKQASGGQIQVTQEMLYDCYRAGWHNGVATAQGDSLTYPLGCPGYWPAQADHTERMMLGGN